MYVNVRLIELLFHGVKPIGYLKLNFIEGTHPAKDKAMVLNHLI